MKDWELELNALCQNSTDTMRAGQAAERIRSTIRGLKQWVNDLQSGMYINCVYCGHRYGPSKDTPVAMADVLKEHIATCPDHPLSEAIARCESQEKMLERAKVIANTLYHKRPIWPQLSRDEDLYLYAEEWLRDLEGGPPE